MDPTTLIDELERVFPKMNKLAEIEIERKLGEDTQTAMWFHRKLTELGEMSLDKLQILSKEPKTNFLPLNGNTDNTVPDDKWQIDITDHMVYARLPLNSVKSRGIMRLFPRELLDQVYKAAGWRIEHRIGVSLTFMKNFKEDVLKS